MAHELQHLDLRELTLRPGGEWSPPHSGWAMARVAIRRAFLLNGELEDHAEHTYAQLVQDHPEWEDQPVESTVVQGYGSFRSWANVFRRIGLDERDHMNNSFVFAGRPEQVVEYDRMPVAADVGSRAT